MTYKSKLDKKEIRLRLIEAGVNNLKEFGYPYANQNNILTDVVYSQIFNSMLNENMGHSNSVDEVINEIKKEIEKL